MFLLLWWTPERECWQFENICHLHIVQDGQASIHSFVWRHRIAFYPCIPPIERLDSEKWSKRQNYEKYFLFSTTRFPFVQPNKYIQIPSFYYLHTHIRSGKEGDITWLNGETGFFSFCTESSSYTIIGLFVVVHNLRKVPVSIQPNSKCLDTLWFYHGLNQCPWYKGLNAQNLAQEKKKSPDNLPRAIRLVNMSEPCTTWFIKRAKVVKWGTSRPTFMYTPTVPCDTHLGAFWPWVS